MHQPNNTKNCPVCRAKVEVGSFRLLVNSPVQDQTVSRAKKYSVKLASLNNQIYQQYIEFIRILDHQLKDVDVSRHQLHEVGAALLINPLSDSLPLSQNVKNSLETIFSRENNQQSGGVSTIAGVPNESPYDVLASKRMEILTLLLHIQKFKRKLNISKPTLKVLQIIKWQGEN